MRQPKIVNPLIAAAVLTALASATCASAQTSAVAASEIHLAQTSSTASFDLPAQALSESLRVVGKRTDTNILIDLKMVEGRQAPALKADLTADQAISRLLEGSGITHRFVDEHTVVLSK